jgi:two-component system, sensor histidine kinase and response regulator
MNLDQSRIFLGTAIATRREKRLALAIASASFLLFIILVPFVRVPLAKLPAFIPSYEAALVFIDLVTAALLLDQCIRLRSPAILVLASGYLFDALIIVPHALTFPGAFAPIGLLGAGEQTTAWLYVFWHGGFPLFIIAYAFLRDRQGRNTPRKLSSLGWMIVASFAGVVLLIVAFTAVATSGHDWLPVVMHGSDYSLLVRKGISPAVWVLTLVAMIALWQREQRMIDLWLMVVMWVWLFDIALAAVIGSTRFDLGFYAGRMFGLIAASFLLITLLVEMAQMHAGVVRAAASAEERLAQLARLRARPDSPARGEPTQSFIHRQNIAHYRSLLESASLDEAQRRLIERLLREEEAKNGSEHRGR